MACPRMADLKQKQSLTYCRNEDGACQEALWTWRCLSLEEALFRTHNPGEPSQGVLPYR